jgi:beta-glucanase (GH16 family)
VVRLEQKPVLARSVERGVRELLFSSAPNRLIAFAILACGLSLAQAPPSQATGYTLVFSDDFNSLDLSDSGNTTWHNGVFYHAKAPDANISTASGLLTLSWTQGQTTPAQTDVATMARDKSKYRAFRYGYFESQFKWDVGSLGAYSAFWLVSSENALGTDIINGNGDGEFCELDIFEGASQYPLRYFGTVHDWHRISGVNSSTTNSPNWTTLAGGTDYSINHLYGMLWVPGSVTFYFDNVALVTVSTPAVCDRQRLYLLLSEQESINFVQGNLTGETAPSLNMNVDYVRVWQIVPLAGPGGK